MYDRNAPIEEAGMCYTILAQSEQSLGDIKGWGELIIFFDILIMLPVIFFLLLDDPHDCFTCLGKDPDRVYSSF